MNEDSTVLGEELPWVSLIMPILRSIANNKIYDNKEKLINGVHTLSTFMNPYNDDVFLKEIREINEWRERQKDRKTGGWPKDEYYDKVLRSLINLINRSGFLPIKKMDVVFEDDIGELDNGRQETEREP